MVKKKRRKKRGDCDRGIQGLATHQKVVDYYYTLRFFRLMLKL